MVVSLVEVEGGEFGGLLCAAGDVGQRRAQGDAVDPRLVQGGIDGGKRDCGPDPVVSGGRLGNGIFRGGNGLLFTQADGVEGGIDGIGFDLGRFDRHQIAERAHVFGRGWPAGERMVTLTVPGVGLSTATSATSALAERA